MRLSTSLGAALIAYAGSALALPAVGMQQGSKHSLYLGTCTTRSLIPGCPLIIICPRQSDPDSSDPQASAQTFNAVSYYENIAATGENNPSEFVTVRERGAAWEGIRSSARLRSGRFYADIDAKARELAKSQIAGSAKVGNENFACFRDGETEFTVRSDGIIGGSTSNCVADYWCASVDV